VPLERYFETVYLSCYSSNFLHWLVLTSKDDSCQNQSSVWWLLNDFFTRCVPYPQLYRGATDKCCGKHCIFGVNNMLFWHGCAFPPQLG
jgi:hypothetical protein